MAFEYEEKVMPVAKLPHKLSSKAELLANMEKLDNKRPFFKGTIFGLPGTGKTITALKIAQALATPEKPGILYVDTAENWASTLNHPELQKNVMRFPYTTYDDLLVLANYIHIGEPPFDKIGSMLIDEYNSYVEHDLNWITMIRSQQAENNKKDFRDPFWPQLPDYMSAQNRSNIFIDALMRLDVNVLAVAHAGKDKDTRWMTVDMSAGARKGLMRKMHVVAYAEKNDKVKGNEQFTLRLSPLVSQKIEAKGRIGKLGDVATAEQVIEAYKSWGDNNDAPIMEVIEKTPELPKNESEDLLSEI